MPRSLAMPVPKKTFKLHVLFRLCLVAIGLVVASSVMSPRRALAEEIYHQYRMRLNVSRPGETASGYTDWLHPSATRSFTASELWWPVYSVLGTDDVNEIIAANNLAGEHPSGGEQETVSLIGGKGTVRYTSTLLGTLKVSDGEHGKGSVVSEVGPIGEVTTSNPAIFAERVHLSAMPDEGYEFDRWEFLCDDFGLGFDSYSDPNTWLNIGFTARDINIRPMFKPLPTQPVTVTDDGHGTGSASMEQAWNGAKVTLVATPSAGWEFDSWKVVSPEGLAIDGNSFVMGNEPVTVKATFKKVAEVVPQGGQDKVPAEGNGEATTGSATEQSPDVSIRSKEGTQPMAKALPATGDAVVPIAIGVIAVAGVCAFVILHRKP